VLVWHWGRRGAGPRFTLNLTRVLASDPWLDVHLSVSRQAEIFASFASLDVPRLDVDTYSGRASAALALHRLAFARARFGRYLRDQRIEVVLCTMTHAWNVAMLGAIRRAGARYILTLHDVTLRDGQNFLLRRWLIGRETLGADVIVTHSRHARAELAATYGVNGDSVRVVPMGMSDRGRDARARPFPIDRPLRLLFFGRISPYKGLELLLEAFAILRRTASDLELVIAGSGRVGPQAAILARAPGVRLENRWIPETEVDEYFRTADLVVLPYREASQSGVVVHAFEHRVPVVATPVGGLVEQVSHLETGVVASAVSAPAIAEAVATLVSSPALYEACSRRIGHVVSSAAAWSTVSAAMSAVIRRVPA
jgi:glycosyltransferase involved in cell wall biosynthesis